VQDLAMPTPVYLELGKKLVFACSLDWPGWARSAKTEEEALEALAEYVDRYRPVAEEAGLRLPKSAANDFDVTERVKGDGTTDFGVPHVPAAADDTALTKAQAERLASLVEATWTVFDRVVKSSPAELRKGPRGGGRDRDKMVAHVVDAEAAYFRKVGVKDGRDAFIAALRAARQPTPDLSIKAWPWRYAARRVAWHVLDHAWEMEDKRP
jgi:predicted RNase H-like HicB family nuclease